MWGKEKVLSFARKLAPLAGGRLRQGEEERIVSGEFPIMASTGGALEAMWKWQAKGAPLVGLPVRRRRLHRIISSRCREIPPIRISAKLFVAFMTTREAQAVMEKHDWRSSYLVDGTLMAKYVKANKIKLQDPGELNEVFMKDDAPFEEELTKILLKYAHCMRRSRLQQFKVQVFGNWPPCN